MTLGNKQQLFQRMIAEFKTWLFSQGYEVRGDDAFRDHRLHGKPGIKKGYGHKDSCHKMKLAEDLYLFSDGIWQKTLDQQTKAGEKWESMGGSWGGRFKRPDANHYSLAWKGMR